MVKKEETADITCCERKPSELISEVRILQKVRIFTGNYAGVSVKDPGVERVPTLVFEAKTYYLKEIGVARP